MAESKKIRRYRETLHEMAKPQSEQRRKELEGKAAKLGHARAGVLPRRLHQQMLGLIFAKHVVDEVGREADLAPGLALARMLALDQPADHRHLAERGLEQIALLDPVDELALEDIWREQGPRIGSSP